MRLLFAKLKFEPTINAINQKVSQNLPHSLSLQYAPGEKGVPVEETFNCNFQHTAKFEFSHPDLRVKLFLVFLGSSSLQNTDSADSQ